MIDYTFKNEMLRVAHDCVRKTVHFYKLNGMYLRRNRAGHLDDVVYEALGGELKELRHRQHYNEYLINPPSDH
jgi:hypothetical protein